MKTFQMFEDSNKNEKSIKLMGVAHLDQHLERFLTSANSQV